jgi:hypothetical protein
MALAHAMPEILKHSCHLAAISGIRLFTLAVVEPPPLPYHFQQSLRHFPLLQRDHFMENLAMYFLPIIIFNTVSLSHLPIAVILQSVKHRDM